MEVLDLNGLWRMRDTRDQEYIEAKVPGSVITTLMATGKLENPYYRDNEDKAFELSRYDYEFTRKFEVSTKLLEHDSIMLCCEGLDTIAEIRVNGTSTFKANNMHRTYEFDLKGSLIEGENTISIIFFSPTAYVEKRQRENLLFTMGDNTDIALDGYYHLRKAHSTFGWDWGPRIPDAGIWRDIYIKGYNTARIENIYVTQEHTESSVTVGFETKLQRFNTTRLEVVIEVCSPDGIKYNRSFTLDEQTNECIGPITIDNPSLWWPNGYGKQPLYKVVIKLIGDHKELEIKELEVGIRKLYVNQETDDWGKTFEFNINGISIFAMGANYIIEDTLMPGYSRERTEKLIKSAVAANFNCIRIWGGGIYPPTYFYELCDKYGIILWHDLMFANTVYPYDEEFLLSVDAELKDNIERGRNHACIGLWNGCNETEWMLDMIDKRDFLGQSLPKEIVLPPMEPIKALYRIIAGVCEKAVAKYDRNHFYWPSSPSSGGDFDNPNDENRGDVHYWDVWHGMKPFTDYRNYYFRFCSEYGFQSFPCLKTVKTYTLPEDRNVFSYIMEKHQKNKSANGKILNYMSETFKYPKNFETLLYTSQLLQAEAIRYGVEHWRRNRGHCMGSLYWQLNDCYPVASWSSIDCYGRWKALHYMAKRFYAPILISALDNGTVVDLYITNDSMNRIKGEIEWKFRNADGTVLSGDKISVELEKLTAKSFVHLDFTNCLVGEQKRNNYLEFSLLIDGKCVSNGEVLFVKPKHFVWKQPNISFSIEESLEEFKITLMSLYYAGFVELEHVNGDIIFSDNYFNLSPGNTKEILINKEDLEAQLNIDELRNGLRARSIFDIEEI